MPLSIKGHYRIRGSEPDGDSVHFHPSNPEAFTRPQLRTHLNGKAAPPSPAWRR